LYLFALYACATADESDIISPRKTPRDIAKERAATACALQASIGELPISEATTAATYSSNSTSITSPICLL